MSWREFGRLGPLWVRLVAMAKSAPVTTPGAQIVAVDSNHDAPTTAAYKYREANVYPYATSKGFVVAKCQGPMARRHYVAPAARQPGIEYISGVGHGHADEYTGDWLQQVFKVGAYGAAEVKDRIVHFLSCDVALTLGPDFVSKGCLAFFGYDGPFTFLWSDADVFFECDSAIDVEFANGRTAADVHATVINLFNRRIADFQLVGKIREAATLQFDRDHLRSPLSGSQWGQATAKLQLTRASP